MSKWGFFSILLRPLTRIGTPKNPDVEVIFTFYPWVCCVQYNTQGDKCNKQQFSAQAQEVMKGVDGYMRIATFLHYLAFYCYICDNRQRGTIVEAYKGLFSLNEDVNYDDFMGNIYARVYQTLSTQEMGAADGLFTLFKPYPSMLTVEKSDSDSFGTFRFLLERKREGFMHFLEMKAGADMIFLPLSIGHLYRYLTEEPTKVSKQFKQTLNILSLELLNSLEDGKSPSMSWQLNQSDKILREYK
jgi:hypothetical protein